MLSVCTMSQSWLSSKPCALNILDVLDRCTWVMNWNKVHTWACLAWLINMNSKQLVWCIATDSTCMQTSYTMHNHVHICVKWAIVGWSLPCLRSVWNWLESSLNQPAFESITDQLAIDSGLIQAWFNRRLNQTRIKCQLIQTPPNWKSNLFNRVKNQGRVLIQACFK